MSITSLRESPTVGASVLERGVRFCVWAPTAGRVEVMLETGAAIGAHTLQRDEEGFFSGLVEHARAGDRYRYRLNGGDTFPDPASRFQPEGVHGPSQVIAASAFQWADAEWNGLRREDVVLYELHVGTFTPAGTFLGVMDRLSYLRDLGVTALELMPVSDFPGARNWGYDVAALYAPARCYGHPDDLRRLVDAAHELGLGVILDVVYNHVGPDGAYWGAFSPWYFSERHGTPWGAAVNLDGPHSGPVRDFLIENAIYWLRDFHVDGLRLDATHALVDDSPVHFLLELTLRVHHAMGARRVLLFAEDSRNDAVLAQAPENGGFGLDGIWADDFHHQVRRHVAGDCESYFANYSGTVSDVAATIQHGWFYRGQRTPDGKLRGTDPSGLQPRRFVFCLQNHDQIGNRAFGERLHHQIDAALYRAITVLLLLSPETPLLFMGQEWAATTPFLFFTNHRADLGQQVTEGRRREFSAFAPFQDEANRRHIPDPQDPATFERSVLRWGEREAPGHAGHHALHREALKLRAELRSLMSDAWNGFRAFATEPHSVLMLRTRTTGSALLIVVQLHPGVVSVANVIGHNDVLSTSLAWQVLLSTETQLFVPDAHEIAIRDDRGYPALSFSRPGAVVLLGH